MKPPLGWPRETDSLCPKCVREARQEILDGKRDYKILLNEKVGEIKATIIERDGKILMVKDCPMHGHFEDVMAIDPAFFKHLEDVFPGSDIRAHNDEKLHNHGSSTIKYGRGSVLTIDLTNRCNMMCDPCFMDANQVGFVHELSLGRHQDAARQRHLDQAAPPDVGAVLGRRADDVAVLPRRGALRAEGRLQQRAGGDQRHRVRQEPGVRARRPPRPACATPTCSSTASATPPTRTAWSATCSTSSCARSRTCTAAGVDIVPVITIVNGINNEQVGRIIQFALDNPKKINFLSFQPVSFTGRDEEVTDERRAAQRYTLSHLAHDVKNQTGLGEPVRDWFPISFMGTFSDWADLVHGPNAEWGNLTLRLPPELRHRHGRDDRQGNQGSRAGHRVPQRRPAREGHRSRSTTRRAASSCRCVGMALALMRNYDPFKAPTHFKLDRPDEEVRQDVRRDRQELRQGHRRPHDATTSRSAARDRWNFLFIAGMWFQDLFNYDFRRTEQCIIPYATQEGEISFCAYNTGVGWRNIIEKMHMTATLTKWYEEHGRHEIFAGGKNVDLPTTAHNLVLDAEAVAAGKQNDLDELGIAKTAREEKLRARADAKKKRRRERAHGRALPPARPEGGAAGAGAPDPGPRRQEEGPGAGSPAQAAAVGARARGSGLGA